MDTLRWGLLSTAHINRRLIPSIRLSNRSYLGAVASRSLSKAQEYAKEWQIPLAFGSYEEMLASNEIDAVYISLPNKLHAEWSINALEAGKHVLCEKPFAVSLYEADRMIQTSERTGKRIAEAFMYRHHPQTQLVKDIIDQKRIGEVLSIRSAFHFRLENPDNIRLSQSLAGGSLWDVGVYPISYAQMIMGAAPQEVFAWQQSVDSSVDTTFFAQMRYPRGVVAQFSCSFDSPFHAGVEIIGTQGRLTVTRPYNAVEGCQINLYKADDTVENIPVPVKDLYLGEVEDMESAVLDGKPNLVTHAQTRSHVQTAMALYQSAREGRVITLE
jgi:predicted dehydrogenase